MSKIFKSFKKSVSGFTVAMLLVGMFAPSVAFGAVTNLTVNPVAPTTDSTPTITGAITEDGLTPSDITVSVDGVPGISFAHDGSGLWTYDVPVAITDGNHVISVTAVDVEDGTNFGPVTTSVSVDATDPQISSVSFAPTSGWTKVGDTIQMNIVADSAGYTAGVITVNNQGVSNFTDLGSGNYSAVYTISEGDIDRAEADAIPVSVELVDNFGRSGYFSENHDALNSPAIDANTPASPTITITDPINIGNLSSVVFTALGEVGTTANFVIDDANVVTSPVFGSVAANTPLTIDVSGLDDGQLAGGATLTDLAGNVSGPGLLNPNAIKDTVAPLAPIVSLVGPINLSNVTAPTLFGTAEAGNLVEYSVTDGINIVTGSGYADGSGNVNITVSDLSGLSDGAITFSATQTDAVGNESTQTTGNVLKDVVLPTVNIATISGSPTNQGTIVVTAEFSENVSGLDSSDLTVAGGNVSGFLGSDKTYVYYVDLVTEGDVNISLGTSVAYDVALNGNVASNTLTVNYDITGPNAPVITSAPTINVINAGSFGITFTNASEMNAVLNYSISDGVTTINSTSANFDGTVSVTEDLSGLLDGYVVVSGYLVDEAGNPGASAIYTLLKDTDAPAMLSLYSTPASASNQSLITVYLEFSEGMFPSALFTDIQDYVTGGVTSNFGPANPSFDVWSFDIERNTSGIVDVNIPNDVFEDFGMNPLLAGGLLSVEFDFDAPLVNSYDNVIAGTTGDTTSVTVNASDLNGIEATITYTDSLGSHTNTVTGTTGVDFEVPTDNLPSDYVGTIDYSITVCDLTNPYATKNCANSVEGTINVTDNDAPNNLVANYLPNPATTGEDVTLAVTADDNIATTSAEISINGGIFVPMNGSNSPFDYSLTVPLTDDSDYDYTVRVYDEEGNYSEISGVIVVIDNDAPVITGVNFTPNPATTGDDLVVDVTATDNIAPVSADITVNGTTQTIVSGSPYGYTFTGVVPANSVAPIAWSVTVWDAAGNSVSDSGMLNVVDNDAPVITGVNFTPNPATTGDDLVVDVTATDNIAPVSADITVNGTTQTIVSGSPYGYTFTGVVPANSVAPIAWSVTVWDAAGNSVSDSGMLNVVDNDAPVITLNGSSEITLEVYSIYNELGAKAIDNVDGNISALVVIGGDVVDTATVGDYVITYNVVDSAGNVATEVERTIHIVDTIPSTVLTFEVTAGDGTVELKWTNPVISDLSGVKIFKSEIAGELGSELAFVSKEKTFYTDYAVENGKTYYYTLKVVDLGGKISDPSSQLSASPKAPEVIYSGGYSYVKGDDDTNVSDGEVKSGTQDNKDDKEDKEEKSALPLLGLLALLVLLGTGLYLLYLQNPQWFAWLFFWKKKNKK